MNNREQLDIVQLKELGLNPRGDHEDRQRLIEAYNKAHHIREFEISLYWARSSYIWTIQAAALAALALLVSEIDPAMTACNGSTVNLIGQCKTSKLHLLIVLALWAFGTFSSLIWLLILRGAKFWQDNWQQYVDLLEGHVSGHIYKVYRTKSCTPPFSVSQLNEAMALFTFMLWLLIGVGTSLIVFHPSIWAIAVIPILLCSILVFVILDSLRMSSLGRKVDDNPSTDGTIEYVFSRRKSGEQ